MAKFASFDSTNLRVSPSRSQRLQNVTLGENAINYSLWILYLPAFIISSFYFPCRTASPRQGFTGMLPIGLLFFLFALLLRSCALFLSKPVGFDSPVLSGGCAPPIKSCNNRQMKVGNQWMSTN